MGLVVRAGLAKWSPVSLVIVELAVVVVVAVLMVVVVVVVAVVVVLLLVVVVVVEGGPCPKSVLQKVPPGGKKVGV